MDTSAVGADAARSRRRSDGSESSRSHLVNCCRGSFAVSIITQQFSCPPLRCSLVNSVATNTSGPVVASASRGKQCPYPALYAVFSLPSICSDRAFNTVRSKFTAALEAVAGPGGEHATFGYCTVDDSGVQAQLMHVGCTPC